MRGELEFGGERKLISWRKSTAYSQQADRAQFNAYRYFGIFTGFRAYSLNFVCRLRTLQSRVLYVGQYETDIGRGDTTDPARLIEVDGPNLA